MTCAPYALDFMGDPRPELDDVLAAFDRGHDPADDFEALAQNIELAEWVLSESEFAQFDRLSGNDGTTYSIRVNGREHETPHVTITVGRRIKVRIFLGATPADVSPDNKPAQVGGAGFNQQIRNRKTREQLLAYVRAHHACLMRAWSEVGNAVAASGLEFVTTCSKHTTRFAPAKNTGPTLNAHMEDGNRALHPEIYED